MKTLVIFGLIVMCTCCVNFKAWDYAVLLGLTAVWFMIPDKEAL